MDDTRLLLVTGLDRKATGWVTGRLSHAEPGTVVVHHDLRAVAEGIVHRTVRTDRESGGATTVVELRHGCVSCTLREDTLPLLRALVARPSVRWIVLHLDPGTEPEAVCWELHNTLVGDVTIADLVTIEAVVAVVDEGAWLAAATGDEPFGLTPEDDRTLAQVAVAQVEFADAIVMTGRAADGWAVARTAAVLDRLAPAAPRASSVRHALDAVPDDARRGAVSDRHAPLLRWSPSLEPDCGIVLTLFEARRPFHPERLHRALDVLLDGVVRSRGRVWVATQPDVALWLESAGGGLRVGHAGTWLAAPHEALAGAPDEALDNAPEQALDTAPEEALAGTLDEAPGDMLARTLDEVPDDVFAGALDEAPDGVLDGALDDVLGAASGDVLDDDAWRRAGADRRAKAAVDWHPRWGDRIQEIAILSHDASPGQLHATLRDALLTDAELTADWTAYRDPFTAQEPVEDKGVR